jgi:hypothetical protein
MKATMYKKKSFSWRYRSPGLRQFEDIDYPVQVLNGQKRDFDVAFGSIAFHYNTGAKVRRKPGLKL